LSRVTYVTNPENAIGELKLQTASPSPWIESPGFDLSIFVLSPLVGVAFLLAYPTGGVLLALAAATLIGGPHYLASFSFFFWDDTAAYHRHRWVIHYLIPAGIVVFVALVSLFQVPAVIIVVIYFWNAYHVSKQSCGILSIYRHRAGIFDQRHKSIANAAIICTNLCMALSHIEWYPALHRILSIPSPSAPDLLWQASALASAATLAALLISLYRRYRNGTGPGAIELSFLVTGLTLFHPYLWVQDNNTATLGMLLGHFIQYLGIVWLVNNRKFAKATGSGTQRFMSRMWRDPRILVAGFLAAGGFFMLLQLQAMAVSITLVLLHFYLDGVFWAFRRPEVRKALGPYLIGWRNPGASKVRPSRIGESPSG
jgi:hypothetical protein